MRHHKLSTSYYQLTNNINSIRDKTSQYLDTDFPSLEIAEYALVRLLDSWNIFVRDITLKSAIGTTESRSSRIYHPHVRNLKKQEEIYLHIVNNWRSVSGQNKPSKHFEPTWFDTAHFDYATKILNITNTNMVLAILDPSNPIDDVRFVRNFVAHRGKKSAERLNTVILKYSIEQWRQPCDIVYFPIAGTYALNGSPFHGTLFDYWCEGLISIADTATLY